MAKLGQVAAAFLALLCASAPAVAETAEERAASLKQWRTNCADPDPVLRLAYMDQAIATEDTSILRICLREALESDDADVRNLGLRAAVASMERIVFETRMPLQLEAELAAAKGQDRRIAELNSSRIADVYQRVKTGMAFQIEGANSSMTSSVWHSLVGLTEPNNKYSGSATIVGSKLSWQGNIRFSVAYNCVLSVSLVPGSRLDGELMCQDFWPIPVSAPLL